EHDDLSRHAPLDPTSIIKHLDTGLGDADGVGVMAMPGVGASAEPRAEELHAVAGRERAHPVAALPRTYKTLARRSPYDAAHGPSLREARGPVEMTREQAVAFILFSVAAAGTPGPSNVLLTAVGANVGILRGLPCLLGVGLGMAIMMFVVAFGLGGVLL